MAVQNSQKKELMIAEALDHVTNQKTAGYGTNQIGAKGTASTPSLSLGNKLPSLGTGLGGGNFPTGAFNAMGAIKPDISAIEKLLAEKENVGVGYLPNVPLGNASPLETNDGKYFTVNKNPATGEGTENGSGNTIPTTSEILASLNKINYTPDKFAYKDFDSSPYMQAIQMAKNNITNRKPFQYDINADPLYQQYKNQYMQQGQLAMQDAIAQASSMTGGYGNSYAAQVGNQAYQQSLSQLNNAVPELYGLAYDVYNNDTKELYNRYDLAVDDYNRALNEYGVGYNKALDEYKQNESGKYNAYTAALDKLKTQYGLNGGTSGSSSGSSSGTSSGSTSLGATVIKPTKTENTSNFNSLLRDENQFKSLNRQGRLGKKYANYKEYVADTLNTWLEQKKLTDEEAAWLWDEHGLDLLYNK